MVYEITISKGFKTYISNVIRIEIMCDIDGLYSKLQNQLNTPNIDLQKQ